jgi:cytochrome c oxidase cbb3-type subunit III
MKKLFVTCIYLGMASLLTAQATVAPASAATASSDNFYRIMSLVLFSVVGILFAIGLYFMVRVNTMLTRELVHAKLGTPEESAVAKELASKLDFWKDFKRKYWEDAVPIEKETDILMHHNYDGIRELDNSLPPWWVNLFYVTIVFAGIYMFWYHFGGSGPSQKEEYEMAIEEGNAIKARARASAANIVDENNLKPVTESALIAEGEAVYKNLCVACHGMAGEGGVGPNMTDDYWIHGGGIKNVYATIKNGVPDKGMISWSSQLSPADMLKVGSYILTLKGTNPPNAKAPQGVVYVEAGTTPDSTTTTTPVKEAKVQ